MEVKIGELKTGSRNSIADVSGVLVGHKTIVDGDVQTGVTAILTKPFNWFRDKTLAACHVINGFGKTVGLTQLEELGSLETPIILTNTLSVGRASDSLVKFMLSHFDEIGGKQGTVNPVVCECNDSYLNNIRKQVVTERDVFHALNNASADFARGSVGAGRGMSCYQLKGGIGTSSRIIDIENEEYVIGGLVLCNMGELKDLRVDGKPIGKRIQGVLDLENENDSGSIIIILATDLPLSHLQLKRMSKRATAGLSRTGTYIGHGSGDIVISFTTQNSIKSICDIPIEKKLELHDSYMDKVFRGVVEVVEASIIDALLSSDEVTGYKGHNRKSLKKYIVELDRC